MLQEIGLAHLPRPAMHARCPVRPVASVRPVLSPAAAAVPCCRALQLVVAGRARQDYGQVSELLDSGKEVNFVVALKNLFRELATVVEEHEKVGGGAASWRAGGHVGQALHAAGITSWPSACLLASAPQVWLPDTSVALRPC
jgi:hypothetical protein